MQKFDIDKQGRLRNVLLENLKSLGVRCRIPKKLKENEKENIYYPDYQIFEKPLHALKMCSVPRLNGSQIEVPEFLADACAVIEKDIKTEGIFRRAGSTCKQREIKLLINYGKSVDYNYHVFDACSLVKLFFRELPQPLIPYYYQDLMLSCLSLPAEEQQVEALMIVCLLLPNENLRTLAFFMEFLLKVSKYSHLNKMSKKNLAIILTPTLMPARKSTSGSLDMTHHFKAFELLIEYSEQIGVVPDHIEESLKCEKVKKKKRSGSLTRMFTGLKKIVGNKAPSTPDWDDSTISTPGSIASLGKRKNSDNNLVSGLLSKKKRIANLLPDGALLATPLRCRMHGYVTPGFTPSMVPRNLKKASSGSPPSKTRRSNSSECKSSSTSIVSKCLTKKQKSLSSVGSTSSSGTIPNSGSSKASIGVMGWARKKTRSKLFLNKSDTNSPEEFYPDTTADSSDDSLQDSELITVNKSEYEEIKNRVIALEEEIANLNANAQTVQTEYEKALEESEKLNGSATDRLARRLNRELKIRSGDRIIRSPSARKIGSIRRRSKESLQRSVENKSSLKRGRPNTLQSGLPSPRTRKPDDDGVTWETPSATNQEFEWQSGGKFFAREHLLQKLRPMPQGRPSIVEIRNHNAGMVMEKAKLFNALNDADQKRQSVRLENLRRLRETTDGGEQKALARSSSLNNQKGGERRATLRRNVSSQSLLKNTSTAVPTPEPKRPTPVIKKSLNTRSPRTLSKTPMSQIKSVRTRSTPVRILLEPYTTPSVSVRRSPRILARALTSSPRTIDE